MRGMLAPQAVHSVQRAPRDVLYVASSPLVHVLLQTKEQAAAAARSAEDREAAAALLAEKEKLVRCVNGRNQLHLPPRKHFAFAMDRARRDFASARLTFATRAAGHGAGSGGGEGRKGGRG